MWWIFGRPCVLLWRCLRDGSGASLSLDNTWWNRYERNDSVPVATVVQQQAVLVSHTVQSAQRFVGYRFIQRQSVTLDFCRVTCCKIAVMITYTNGDVNAGRWRAVPVGTYPVAQRWPWRSSKTHRSRFKLSKPFTGPTRTSTPCQVPEARRYYDRSSRASPSSLSRLFVPFVVVSK